MKLIHPAIVSYFSIESCKTIYTFPNGGTTSNESKARELSDILWEDTFQHCPRAYREPRAMALVTALTGE